MGEATKEKKGRNCQRIEVSVDAIDLQGLVLEVQNKQTPGTHPPKNNLFSAAAAAEREQQVLLLLLLLLLLCCVHLHPLQITVFFLQCTCCYWFIALELLLLLLQEVIYLSQLQLTKICGQFFFSCMQNKYQVADKFGKSRLLQWNPEREASFLVAE